MAEEVAPRRKSVLPLVIALLVLLLLLAGLAWIYLSLMSSPPRRVLQGNSPGITFKWGAYAYRDTNGKLVQMEGPVGVAYDGNNNRIYVTLPRADTVAVFDSNGRNGRVFVKEDTSHPKKKLSDFKVIRPSGIDVDEAGNVYVASEKKASVTIFSPAGEKLRELPVMSPTTVHVAGNQVYILGKGTLYVYNRNGTPAGQWGTYGRTQNQMAYPVGLTTMQDGTILIADTNNYKMIALSPRLEPEWIFGKSATTRVAQDARILGSPMGVAMGSDGNAYMVDALNNCIRVFDRSGNMLGEPLGSMGKLDNQFTLPTHIAHMAGDLFVVTDTANNRILGLHINKVGDQKMTPKQSVEPTAASVLK